MTIVLSPVLAGVIDDIKKHGAAVRLSRSSSNWRLAGNTRKHETMQQLVRAGLAVQTGQGVAGVDRARIDLTAAGWAWPREVTR